MKRGYRRSFRGYGLPLLVAIELIIVEQRAGGDRGAETKGQAIGDAAQGGFKKW
jgi:hypothetical protein